MTDRKARLLAWLGTLTVLGALVGCGSRTNGSESREDESPRPPGAVIEEQRARTRKVEDALASARAHVAAGRLEEARMQLEVALLVMRYDGSGADFGPLVSEVTALLDTVERQIESRTPAQPSIAEKSIRPEKRR